WLTGATAVAATATAVAAARHARPAEVSPVVPHGSWNAVWVASVVVGLAAYVAGVVQLGRRGGGTAATLCIAIAIQALPLAAPLLLSKDTFLYWSEGRTVLVHDASPYRATPSDYPTDPATELTSESWLHSSAPYGPTWETLSLVPAAAAGSSPKHATAAYKAFAFLGILFTLSLLAAATRRAWTVALLGWNPLVALHFAGGGHSDAWLVALLCGSVLMERAAAGGIAWSLAAAFKPVGAILLPLDLAATRLRRPRAFWIGLIAAATAIAVGTTAAWGSGWLRASLVGVHGTSPLGGVHWLTEAGLTHHDAVAVGAAVFAAAYCGLVYRAWRHGRAHLALAATALCLTSSLLRPWYAVWPLALAAIEEDWIGAAAAVALSGYLLLGDAVQF
ncbi:MAG: hypothetical protein ABUS54_07725, partial [Actinomycetota bacterium]